MPIRDFEGHTFVAFTDISGFKKMVAHRERAENALNHFYSIGYEHLDRDTANSRTPTVEGIFVSDCGILFVRDNGNTSTTCLVRLLEKIRAINRALVPLRVTLSTSIAYGHFSYQELREHHGIIKDALFGRAYLNAYLDTQSSRPKLECGQCRLVNGDLPEEITAAIRARQGDVFSMMRPFKQSHHYFYWMRDHANQIDEFEANYRNADDLKYEGIRRLLAGENINIQ